MSVSANQLSLYGAVAEMCEVYETVPDRSGRLDVVMGQSIVLSAINTEVLLENDDPAYQTFLLQQYEPIEKLSQQDRLNKFCMGAGFLSVENGQYFTTMENNFMQRVVVNTLFPEKKNHHNRKDVSKETPKIGPVLEVTTIYLHGKHRVEIRIMSLSRDTTDSWVRISHGSHKFCDGFEQQRHRNS